MNSKVLGHCAHLNGGLWRRRSGRSLSSGGLPAVDEVQLIGTPPLESILAELPLVGVHFAESL